MKLDVIVSIVDLPADLNTDRIYPYKILQSSNKKLGA